MSQQQILEEIHQERERQNKHWGEAAHNDAHTIIEFVQLIRDYASWARVMGVMNSHDKARRRLVQVAALAVAAIESIDRRQIK